MAASRGEAWRGTVSRQLSTAAKTEAHLSLRGAGHREYLLRQLCGLLPGDAARSLEPRCADADRPAVPLRGTRPLPRQDRCGHPPQPAALRGCEDLSPRVAD